MHSPSPATAPWAGARRRRTVYTSPGWLIPSASACRRFPAPGWSGNLCPLRRCTDVMRTREKICGITRAEDAQAAARLGADAIGLEFHARSPRAVTIELARAGARALPPFVSAVGVFGYAVPEAVELVLKTVPLDLLQFL